MYAVTATNILNGNKIGALNNVLNGDKHSHKRGGVNVNAPITIEEIFDCNDIQVANDILNGLAAELGCLVKDLGITVQDILDCNASNYSAFMAKLYANLSKFSNPALVKSIGEKRGDDSLIGIDAPSESLHHSL